jgi:hypothetical protein
MAAAHGDFHGFGALFWDGRWHGREDPPAKGRETEGNLSLERDAL